MPPPRRRRPVQPATRVRLPRPGRPRTGPAAEPGQADWAEDANGHAADLAAAGNGNRLPADLATAEPPGPQAPDDVASPAAGAEAAVGKTGAGTAADDGAGAEAATDETAAKETADGGTTDIGTADIGTADIGTADIGTAADEEDTAARPGESAVSDQDQDEDEDDLDLDEDDLDEPAEEAGAGREPMLLPVCLQVVAVILGGLAVWFALKSGGSASPPTAFGGPAATNVAVIHQSATTQVNQQIDSAVDTVFSYSYADTAKTARAAQNLLTGRARQEYATLFKEVARQAPAEKLVLTTTVTNSGVETLSGNTARLLIFANQQDTATSTHSTTDAGAMFSVTALRQGGRWKIRNIDTFSAGG